MCGIAGYIGNKRIEVSAIKKTLALMKNRGPDNQSWFKVEKKNFNVFFLHSRLSIIDLNQRSNQPFRFENFIIVFNGEIYNFIEIKENLIKLGYHFSTNSDTEVLLKAYIEYGEDCVNHFNGMWAFAIWDESEDTFALVNADVDGESTDPSVDFAGSYAPLHVGDLTASQSTVTNLSVTGELTLGDKVLSGTELELVNNISQIGQSENGKALTQNSSGVVKIGEVEGSQVLELVSHSDVHSALKLGNVSVNATGAEINVPLFINEGDKIKVDTEKGIYLERIK